ncbi:MAG: hypothetical protein O7G85_03165 [Planctomycetota bacterium]|nr:hypothetical protein [Planctomycetota bacterium]
MIAGSNPVLGQVDTDAPTSNIVPGETLDPSHYGESRVESMEEAIRRDHARPQEFDNPKGRSVAQGVWTVPSRRGTFYPHSGNHYITNKWGDTRMGIGFPRPMDVHGVYVAGQAADGVWTTGLRVSGYRDGQLVDQTDWFENIDESPDWFAIDLVDVDRIVFEARAVLDGSGWYALDDLTFSMETDFLDLPRPRTVLDFEDGGYRRTLTDSDYQGSDLGNRHGRRSCGLGGAGPRAGGHYGCADGQDFNAPPAPPGGSRDRHHANPCQ